MAVEQDSISTISRREMLQRGAVAGGLIWAAPAFSVLGPRAFASTTGTPYDGLVSWVMVWFVDTEPNEQGTNDLYRVKYESVQGSYSAQPGVTKQQLSRNDPNADSYYDRQEFEVNDAFKTGLVFVPSLPPSVDASASNGSLQLGLSGSIAVYGWILHDGSCQAGGSDFLRAAYVNPGGVGPEVPAQSGAFLWQKCT